MRPPVIVQIEELLRGKPGQTARQLATSLTVRGMKVSRTIVNSVLYRYPEAFKNDGGIPPKWSLARDVVDVQERTPHRVRGFSATNWKAFDNVRVIFGGVTLVFGENSSGKSSIFQGLLLMQQSWRSGHLVFEGDRASFGWFEHVAHRHRFRTPLELSAFWDNPATDGIWGISIQGVRGEDGNSYSDTLPIGVIACHSPSRTVAFQRIDNASTDDVQWIVADDDVLRAENVDPNRTPIIGSTALGFPDPDQSVVDVGQTGALAAAAKGAIAASSAMMDSVLHIGPFRLLPDRVVRLSWAREHGDYLVRLLEDEALLQDVNEWLERFDVPYVLEIARYGDDEGDELFDLNLKRIGQGRAETVQLNDVGFGISQLLPIIVAVLGSREKTILIEEPEAHVHPRLQSVLADLFVTGHEDYGNVIVAETHSEAILLRLQRRVAEGRISMHDMAVLHIHREGAAAAADHVPVSDNGQLDYEWPGGFFDNRLDDLVAILDPLDGA